MLTDLSPCPTFRAGALVPFKMAANALSLDACAVLEAAGVVWARAAVAAKIPRTIGPMARLCELDNCQNIAIPP